LWLIKRVHKPTLITKAALKLLLRQMVYKKDNVQNAAAAIVMVVTVASAMAIDQNALSEQPISLLKPQRMTWHQQRKLKPSLSTRNKMLCPL
jgi:hypothetical protein